jgi:hypothetical protein
MCVTAVAPVKYTFTDVTSFTFNATGLYEPTVDSFTTTVVIPSFTSSTLMVTSDTTLSKPISTTSSTGSLKSNTRIPPPSLALG